MVYVGIDMHSRNMIITAINDNGELVKSQKINCNEEERHCFFREFDQPIQAVVEATASWYWISDWCQQQGISLLLAHAKMLKAISYAKVKTDAVDSRTLAELLRAGLIPKAWKVSRYQRDLRELTRARLRLVVRRTSIQNQIKTICGRYNARLHGLSWADLDQIQRTLAGQLPHEAMLDVTLSLEQLNAIQIHVQRLEEAIEKNIWFSQSVQRLMEVPGIGRVTAWTIISEIGDIKRFPTDRKFVSYCRLVPGSKDSGQTKRHKSGSKDGNRYLKMVFMHAAIAAIRSYGPVRKYFNKIKRRSGQQVARAVIGKHLAKVVWHMLVKNQPFKGFKGHRCKESEKSGWPRPINPKPSAGT
ncbi:MAG: IS110 family transposase [Balneolales bacterium]